jgi:hypothetical protein
LEHPTIAKANNAMQHPKVVEANNITQRSKVAKSTNVIVKFFAHFLSFQFSYCQSCKTQ